MELSVASESRHHHEIRLSTELPLNSVNWEGVSDLLVKRFHLTIEKAAKKIDEFVQLFIVPLEPFWFSRTELSSDYNRLLACICEVHGVDSITLHKEIKLDLGPLSLSHKLKIKFTPALKNLSKGEGRTAIEPQIDLQLFGRSVTIRNQREVLSWRILALSSAIILSVPFLGCFLYSFAVFMVFLESPSEFTIVAFDHASLGLALLCFFVGFAGLFGRAAVNTTNKLKEISRKNRAR